MSASRSLPGLLQTAGEILYCSPLTVMLSKDTVIYGVWRAVSSPVASVASAAAQTKLMEHIMDFSLAWKRKINFHLIEQEVTKYY